MDLQLPGAARARQLYATLVERGHGRDGTQALSLVWSHGMSMDITGEYLVPAPQQRVWEALNDPAVLKASIAGCQALEKVSDTEFNAIVTTKVGPVSATFRGNVQPVGAGRAQRLHAHRPRPGRRRRLREDELARARCSPGRADPAALHGAGRDRRQAGQRGQPPGAGGGEEERRRFLRPFRQLGGGEPEAAAAAGRRPSNAAAPRPLRPLAAAASARRCRRGWWCSAPAWAWPSATASRCWRASRELLETGGAGLAAIA